MYYDYRVIKHTNHYDIREVTFDENKQPVLCSPHPITLSGDSVDDLTTLLIYSNRALTEPIIDVNIFDNGTQSALDIMRSK